MNLERRQAGKSAGRRMRRSGESGDKVEVSTATRTQKRRKNSFWWHVNLRRAAASEEATNATARVGMTLAERAAAAT
ncbi:UNVERIFIED_CONTAM: hypothetical protein HHA_453740 [Hammondia hammondi]|eukprot:XP_008887076.1 hypothetical protein HHA_453740 [Hammondia hammondi]